MEGGESCSFSCCLGDALGDGVNGNRPPAVLVEKTLPFMGVQTSTVAIIQGYD
jgi:hypothetical protein